jgi:serine/threonine protein kinase
MNSGFLSLTDFGCSKDNMFAGRRTFSLLGTPEYQAPEQLFNRKSSDSSHKSSDDGGYGTSIDWWAFGCLIYEMLTGDSPFYSMNSRFLKEDILNK